MWESRVGNMDRKNEITRLASASIRLLRTSVLNDRFAMHTIGGGLVALFSWVSLTAMFCGDWSGGWSYLVFLVFPIPSIGIAVIIVAALAECRLSLVGLFLAYAFVDAISFGLTMAVGLFYGGLPMSPPV